MTALKVAATALTFATLVGCISAGGQSKLNRVSIGMTKPEVIEAMGEPNSVSAIRDTEYLNYSLSTGTDVGTAASCAGFGLISFGLAYTKPECRGGPKDDFFVRLYQGKVDAYGKTGDFDSTKDPTLNVNSTIQQK